MFVNGDYLKLILKLMVEQTPGQGMPVQLNTPSQPSVTQVGTQASTNASKSPGVQTPPRVQRRSATQSSPGVQIRNATSKLVQTRSASQRTLGLQRRTAKKK